MFATLLAAFAWASTASAPPRHCLSIAAPSYFYPGEGWNALLDAAPQVQLAVINPSSGVGHDRDLNYARVTHEATTRGLTVLGYVHTDYGRRDLDVVMAEVERYVAWYGVRGIFVDEAATSLDALAYYEELSARIEAYGLSVVLNPGAVPDQAYAAIADVLITFEGSAEAYRTRDVPGWMREYAPSRFWHVVHGVSSEDTMNTVVALAGEREAQHLWVASESGANPYAAPPHQFEPLLDALAARYAFCQFR
ncbi:MAG: spherulation-specific family 4 protein [Myxococcota bacterium]